MTLGQGAHCFLQVIPPNHLSGHKLGSLVMPSLMQQLLTMVSISIINSTTSCQPWSPLLTRLTLQNMEGTCIIILSLEEYSNGPACYFSS